jgi:threonyl-tRNA synthetase
MDKQDHRRVGQELDLFHFEEEAPGMVFWHPRGWAIYRALEEAVRRLMARQGLQEVRSPQVLRQAVWEASGHWDKFPAGMFRVEDERPCALKPVSCPAHLMMARRASLSYRDLPYGLGELGLVHRNEQSGVLHGLFRLRQFAQDDGHILCAEEQVIEEVVRFCNSLAAFYAAFGFAQKPGVAFSSRPSERLGDDAVWDRAERLLLDAARAAGLECRPQAGEGAFYGPKLEFSLEDQHGRAWQCGTIQLDLVLAERFDVAYVAPDGQKRRPAVLHRAVLGSLERFLGMVLEQGRLPHFLAPEQVVIAPVSEAQRAPAEALAARFGGAALRARVDASNESLSRRIVDAHQRAVPFIAVLGAREVASDAVALRSHEGQRVMPVGQALAELSSACAPPL